MSCFSYCFAFATERAERILEELREQHGDVALYHFDDFRQHLGEAFLEASEDDLEAFEEIFELINEYQRNYR